MLECKISTRFLKTSKPMATVLQTNLMWQVIHGIEVALQVSVTGKAASRLTVDFINELMDKINTIHLYFGT